MSEEKEKAVSETDKKAGTKSGNSKKKRGGKGAFILGLTVVLLAAVGAGFLINLGIGQVKKLTGNDGAKSEYESYLYPVVTLDPDTFDDVTGANMKDLICASILSLLTDNENNPYSFDFVEGEISGMGIPQETVEKAFKKLFGSDAAPVHQSVECSTCIFTYQSSAKRYVIPLTGYDPAYVPDVIEINKTREGNAELLVGYIAYGDWEKTKDSDFTSPEPAKYRKITLRKTKDGYYISSIQNAEAKNK